MIEVKDLTKKYGSNTAVNHLNFTIETGKIYGFLGPNGAGKSTTMNMITGCLASTEGTVIVDGHDILDDPIEAKKLIGYLPEQPPLYQDMTPHEYLTFVARAKGIERGKVSEAVSDAMEETGITSMQNRLIKNLSKGYKQRVGISQAILGDPELIILDEPTVGLDPKQIIEIRDLIRNLGENRTVMISSHILAEISEICDHVMIINHGNLVASDTLENIMKQFTSENTIYMTVKADKEAIDKVVDEVNGVLGVEITPSREYEGYNDLKLDVEPIEDIRDQLVFAFVRANCAVKKIDVESLSLEEIFIKLTSDTALPDDEDESDDSDQADIEDPLSSANDASFDSASFDDPSFDDGDIGEGDARDNRSASSSDTGEDDDYVPMFRIQDREDDE